MLPPMIYYEHELIYRPSLGQDSLRIVVDRANMKMVIKNP
jgi:hypothetical protein